MAIGVAAPRSAPSPGRRVLRSGLGGDALFRGVARAAGILVLAVVAGTFVFILGEASGALTHYGPLSFLTSTRWAPSEATVAGAVPNPYGIVQFIYGTLITALLAMLLAVPIAISVALFIADFAPRWLRAPLTTLVDLLAAVPSVVYGFWGIFALVPALLPVGNWLSQNVGHLPIIGLAFSGPFFGYSYFSASIVLAIMVIPIITAVSREIFVTSPRSWKEASYALGATRWEAVKVAVLRPSRNGLVGASILGLGRALGETIAVTMLIGNSVVGINASLLSQGATMASVIANEFTEATEPHHLQALFVVALFLFLMAVVANVVARRIVNLGVSKP